MKILFLNKLFLITIAGAFMLTGCSKGNEEWRLVWSDEFNYEGLPNSQKWDYDTVGNAYGWGNNELQFYTYGNKSNAWVDGNHLRITARNEKHDGFDYSSARLITKDKKDWLYGKIEVRGKLPGGKGVWPAIWMLPTDSEYGNWPRSGEIDIMEYVGFSPDSVHFTVHTHSFNHIQGTQKGQAIYLPDCEDDFNVYGIEWFENRIDFFVNDTIVFTFHNSGEGPDEWPFDQRFYLLLNVAVGGIWGGLHGVDDSVFPAEMVVDYVRVYERVD